MFADTSVSSPLLLELEELSDEELDEEAVLDVDAKRRRFFLREPPIWLDDAAADDDVDASDDDEDTERISLRRSNICQPKLLSCDQSHVFCAPASSCRNPHTFASVIEATNGT